MSKRSGVRILVVEDREVMLKILRRLLAQLGFETIEQATDGKEALEKIRSSTYDLILSDWNMDGMSGFELLKIVRANQATASVPFILVTAESKPENILAAKAAGANAYLLKPFKLDVLETTIEHALAANDFLASVPANGTTSKRAG